MKNLFFFLSLFAFGTLSFAGQSNIQLACKANSGAPFRVDASLPGDLEAASYFNVSLDKKAVAETSADTGYSFGLVEALEDRVFAVNISKWEPHYGNAYSPVTILLHALPKTLTYKKTREG